MNENMPRWIWASFTEHFDARKQKYPMYIEGYDRVKNPTDGFEFRLDGPNYSQPSANFEIYDIFINILVTSIKDDKDAHKIHRVVGIAASMFTESIPIYRYGNISGVDDNSLIDCFELQTHGKSALIITNFGLIQPTQNVMQSTVEAHYQLRRTT